MLPSQGWKTWRAKELISHLLFKVSGTALHSLRWQTQPPLLLCLTGYYKFIPSNISNFIISCLFHSDFSWCRAQPNIQIFGLLFILPLFEYQNKQPIIFLLFVGVLTRQITLNLTRLLTSYLSILLYNF